MRNFLAVILSIIACTLVFQTEAQTFLVYGDRTFGSNLHEFQVRLSYSGGNNFYMVGNSYADINGDKTDPKCDSSIAGDVWMLSIDTAFNILWDKSIGGRGADRSPYPGSQNNLSVIFTANSDSDSSCEKSENSRGGGIDYWIYKSDSNGNKIWDKTLGGNGADVSPRIIQLSTGDYIVTGISTSPINGDKTIANHGIQDSDFWTIKLDSSGNKIWDKVYGGIGDDYTLGGSRLYLFACENDNFIITGVTECDSSGDISQPSRGMSDIWMIKCDSAGNKIWDKRFGGVDNDFVDYVAPTSDKGYLIAGTTWSPQSGDVTEAPIGNTINNSDCWIVKLDSVGNKVWDKRYGGVDAEFTYSVVEDNDAGFLIGAITKSGIGYDVSEPSYGGYDYWVFKIDSNGNKIWDKRFGGPGDDFLSNTVFMPDSSIVLAGFAGTGVSVVKSDSGKGGSDNWIVRFKYLGGSVGINSSLNAVDNLQLYPNPATDKLNIRLTELRSAPLIVDIYDIVGQKVQTVYNGSTNGTSMQLDANLSGINPGVYLIRIQQEGVITKRFVKL